MSFLRRVGVTLAALCCAAPGVLAAEQVLSEHEALKRFTEESPRAQVLQARLEAFRAETRIGTEISNQSVAYTVEDAAGVREDFFIVQQRLPVTGHRKLLRRTGDAAYEAARLEVERDLLEIQTELRLAFYELLLAERKHAVLANGLERHQEIVRVLREREKEGESSRFDRLRADREMAEVSADLALIEDVQALARARLASFFAHGTTPVGLRATGDFEPGPLEPWIEPLIDEVLEARSDYRAVDRRLEQYETARRAARRKRFPDPEIAAGWKRVDTLGLSDSGYVVSVGIPIPVFNRGQHEEALARAEYESAILGNQVLRQQIETEVRGAYAAAELSRRTADRYGHTINSAAGDLSRIAQLAYEEGEQRILELLDAYRTELQSQIRWLDLKHRAKEAQIRLELASGKGVTP